MQTHPEVRGWFWIDGYSLAAVVLDVAGFFNDAAPVYVDHPDAPPIMTRAEILDMMLSEHAAEDREYGTIYIPSGSLVEAALVQYALRWNPLVRKMDHIIDDFVMPALQTHVLKPGPDERPSIRVQVCLTDLEAWLAKHPDAQAA